MKLRLNLVIVSCLAIMGICAAAAVAQTSLDDFGLDEKALKSGAVDSLAYGTITVYPDRKLFKEASPSARAAFVRSALGWVKAYTETDAFKADYRKKREAARPAPPKSKGTPDEQHAKVIAEQRKGIEDMKKTMSQMPPDMQKQMQETIKQLEANLARTAKDPQMAAMMKQGFEQTAASEKRDYQGRVEAWEKKYPADPKVLIAARLRQFLDLSRDIPFDARLVKDKYGKMRFVDSQYESRPSEWKLCYRAGREPVQAARAFAQEWLGQIEKK
ncbi:MAG TPA: hypothetical protein PKM41_01655 [Deltaproteobacteria bacterium]|jgi:hypothetical protein|nr:hypothetical protein [Deltaproteobacteria bacterium]HOI07064.1 hypothetical protein [Deltaproteobacteria bacterium]